jgi:hypothetical protein
MSSSVAPRCMPKFTRKARNECGGTGRMPACWQRPRRARRTLRGWGARVSVGPRANRYAASPGRDRTRSVRAARSGGRGIMVRRRLPFSTTSNRSRSCPRSPSAAGRGRRCRTRGPHGCHPQCANLGDAGRRRAQQGHERAVPYGATSHVQQRPHLVLGRRGGCQPRPRRACQDPRTERPRRGGAPPHDGWGAPAPGPRSPAAP